MFRRKKHKPRLVPGPPPAPYLRTIPPEELPEPPAERIARLQLERQKSKDSKPAKTRKAKPGQADSRGRKDENDQFEEELSPFAKEEGTVEHEKTDAEATSKPKSTTKIDKDGPSSPPPVSVEIQIEPPLEELPIDIVGDGDEEDLIKGEDKKASKDTEQRDRKDGKKDDARVESDADVVAPNGAEGAVHEADGGVGDAPADEEHKEVSANGKTAKDETGALEIVETRKEKKRRGLFARRKKEPRDASTGTEKSGEPSGVDDESLGKGSFADNKGSDKKERGRRYLKRKDADKLPKSRTSDLSPTEGGLQSLSSEDEMLDAHHRRRSPRRSRRASTIGGTDSKRRLSSYTTSSGDTAIDFENSEDEVKENIRYHKNMIESIKTQPWSMAKKLRMLRTAKAYIKKHEGELAQSKQARDIFATYSNWFRNSLHRLKREIADLIITLTPWEMRIKRIESHFGSVVASYFIFLRWVFWLNSFISLFICCFLMVPEVLRGDDDITGMRKKVKDDEAQNALNLKEVWEFEGYLKYSPIFYGYYSDREVTPEGYRLPLAYLLSSLVMYMFSFFMILRKMTSNNKQSKMIEKEDECTFAWKLYTGWDYMIGNAETAHNKVSSLVMSFKESILEEKERRKEERSWKLITLRTFTNFLVLLLLGSSAYAVILVVARGEEPEAQKSWYRQNEVTLVLTGISNVYPNFFDLIGAIEQYHPRQQLQWQLFRILMLYMLNLYTLIFALFGKVRKMTSELSGMRENITFLIESGAFDRRNSLPVEPNAAMDNLTSLDFFTELPMSPLEEFLHDAVKTFPKLDLSNCLTCSWLPIKCSLLLLILNSTFPVRVPNEMFYSVMPEPCGAIPSYNQSWCIDSAWNSSIEYNQTAQDDRDWNSSLPCPPPSTVSTTTTTTTAKTYSLEQIALFIANYTISHHFNNNLTPNGSPEVTPNDAFASNLFGSEFNVSDATNLLFYDNLSNFTSLSGNDTERPTFTLVQTSTVSVAEEDYLPVERMNCTNVYMPYCGSLPIPKELKEEEQTTASDIDYISTTSRPPGYISQDELNRIDESDKDRLRKLCWETMFGQEIVKLTVMDLAMTIGTTVLTDYIRAVFIRYLNNYCCWDMEVGWPGYGDFKIAENILHLVNNQGMVWMGMFFSPGLPAINTIKLALMMYVRSWAVLTSNIPHETVFKASGNNFYYMLLLVMLFICTLPVGYAMVWLEPSWHCGPFSGCKRAYKVFTNYLKRTLPKWLNIVLEYCCSAGAIIPLILLLVLVIYYLSSITGSLRESNNDLMAQIRREKEEKRAKKAEEESTKLSKIPLDIESKPAITNEDQAEKAEKILNMWSAASRRQSMVQKLKGSSSPLQRAVALTQEHLYKEKDDFESSETSRGPAAPSWNVAVQEHVDRARQMDRKDGRRPLRSQRSDEEPLVSSVNTSNMGYKQLEEIRAVEQLRAFREKKRRQRVPKIMISKDGTEELQASIDSEAAQKDGQTLEGPQAQESRGSKASSSTADNQPLLLDPTKSPIPIKGKKFKPTLRRETAKYPVEEDQSPGGSQSVSSNAGTSTKGSYSPSQTTDVRKKAKSK